MYYTCVSTAFIVCVAMYSTHVVCVYVECCVPHSNGAAWSSVKPLLRQWERDNTEETTGTDEGQQLLIIAIHNYITQNNIQYRFYDLYNVHVRV